MRQPSPKLDPLHKSFFFGRYTRQGALAYAAEISGTQ
jgi:hypothetical protein